MSVRVKVPVSLKCDLCGVDKETSGVLTYTTRKMWNNGSLTIPAVLILSEGWTKGILMCTRDQLHCPQCAKKAKLEAPLLLVLEISEEREIVR